MQAARRVYLYLISFISLQMVLTGAANLLRLLAEIGLSYTPGYYGAGGPDVYRREQFSLWSAMLIVGGIVWAIHWLLAQRGVAPANPQAADERQSVLRKLFLYAVLATALTQVAGGLVSCLYTLLRAAPVPDSANWSDELAQAGLQAAVYAVAWLYYWHVRTADHAATPEQGPAATVRRWYFYLVNYVALTALLILSADLAGNLWRMLTSAQRPLFLDVQWVPSPIAFALAGILVVGSLWLWHWRVVQRQALADEAEQHATLRQVYLYGMTLQTVAVTLANVAFFLYNLFRLFWGSDPVSGTGDTVLTAAGGPVLTALIYGVFWAYHWWVLKLGARRPGPVGAPGPAFHSTLRRLYHYLVAIIGLALLAGGVADMLRLLIDGGLGGSDATSLSRQAWGDQISFCATLLVVGAPVWLVSWWAMQREALPASGAAARQSLPRRLYLFLILFATVIALLGSMAVLIYQVLRNIGTPTETWVSGISWALGTALTASVGLGYHGWVLAADLRARVLVPATGAVALPGRAEAAPAAATILFLAGADAGSLAPAGAPCQLQLPAGVRVEVIPAAGVTAPEVRAWLVERGAGQAGTFAPPPGPIEQCAGPPPLPRPQAA